MSKNDNTEVIFSYTRREALADGVLIDATELAREAGFLFPVALTTAAWSHYVTVPENCPWQDETGRLWDILSMLSYRVKKAPGKNPLYFSLRVQNSPCHASDVTLKAACGPGDCGEPVVTVMLPDED